MGSLLYGDAIHIREQSKIDAARITQKSGNELRGAQTALQQFSASLANSRAMEAAGKQINASTENIARNLDASTSADLSLRIQAAEELGANVAMAAAAGVGGSSVEAYNQTLRLSQAMREEQGDRATRSDLINATMARGDALIEATAGLDNNVYRANLDYTQYVDHKKMGTFERLGFLGMAAAATVFGGPQAGAAVVGLAESKQAAMNGDFGTASQSLTGAVQQGLNSWRTTRSLDGNFWRGQNLTPHQMYANMQRMMAYQAYQSSFGGNFWRGGSSSNDHIKIP